MACIKELEESQYKWTEVTRQGVVVRTERERGSCQLHGTLGFHPKYNGEAAWRTITRFLFLREFSRYYVKNNVKMW